MSLRVLVGAEIKPGETRTAVTPELAAEIIERGHEVGVQRFLDRAIPDDDFVQVGARLAETARDFDVVIATKEWTAKPGSAKEIFPNQLLSGFHHVHKGQEHNLPTLAAAMERGASLFDYELFRPEGASYQPVTTSRFAGIAGAVNGVWALAQRLAQSGRGDGVADALGVPCAWGTTEKLRERLSGLPPLTEDFTVVVVGKTGVCGQGAIDVCKWLNLTEIKPEELSAGPRRGPWYCALGTEDIVRRTNGGSFDHAEYRELGKRAYENSFDQYLGKFNLLVFCPYWDDRYPKILPRDLMIARERELPMVVSDVTCDLGGSTECTWVENKVKSPVSTYDPQSGVTQEGMHPGGVVVTAVDNLPAQLGVSCSRYQSEQIGRHIVRPWLDYVETARSIEDLPEGARTGFITWRGRLVERFKRLKDLL